MSDMFFFDTGESPRPRDEVEISKLTATPYPEGTRVKVEVHITPFLERPNLEIYAKQQGGQIVAEMSVIETMQPLLEFTLHIRDVESVTGEYTLVAELFYDDRTQPQHTQAITFEIP